MKKTFIVLGLSAVFAFANDMKSMNNDGCKELRLNEVTSIISCGNIQFEATFELNGMGKRSNTYPPKLKPLNGNNTNPSIK